MYIKMELGPYHCLRAKSRYSRYAQKISTSANDCINLFLGKLRSGRKIEVIHALVLQDAIAVYVCEHVIHIHKSPNQEGCAVLVDIEYVGIINLPC